MKFLFDKYLLIVILYLNSRPSGASYSYIDSSKWLMYSAEEIELCNLNNASIVDSINGIGLKLLNRMTSSPGNIFLSPLGVSELLGMLYAGLSGKAAEQWKSLFNYAQNETTDLEIHGELQRIREIIKQQNKETNFIILNGAYTSKELKVNDKFSKKLKKFYHVDLKQLSFGNDSEMARETINEWASNITENQINAVLSETSLEDIRLLLLNAVSFKGTWKVQFSLERTELDYFYTGWRETTVVPMMSLDSESFKYLDDFELKYKFIELPYEGDRMSILVAIPTQYDQPADLKMDVQMLCEIRHRMVMTKLDIVAIPRFKFEYEKSLKEDLIALGLKDVFDHASSNSSEDIYTSDLIQKTMVEVNEEGAEKVVSKESAFMPVAFREIMEFVANHPFLFYVIDTNTSAIVFAGRVDEPNESTPVTENLRFI